VRCPGAPSASSPNAGRPVEEIGDDRLITRAQLKTRIDRLGQKRAAYTTCMTCVETAQRWPDDPINNLHRELAEVQRLHQWMPHPQYWARRDHKEYERYERDRKRHDLLALEIEAITALIDAHRDEFGGYLAGVEDTTSLAQARAARSRRAALPPNVIPIGP
jgi:hypothetical protein